MTKIMIAVLIALIATAVYLEIKLWQECRQTNSLLFCVRVLSK